MRVPVIALALVATLLSGVTMVYAQVGGVPEAIVECTGWHALCSLATDCEIVNGGKQANCPCWRVNEPHFVVTADIQNEDLRGQTWAQCTLDHPCLPGEAPICVAIANGTYTVDDVQYQWVSTFSYRGFCENWDPVPCAAAPWADCMTFPCTENTDPKSDPDRPLICQCRIVWDQPFVGSDGGCKSKKGTVMSTINQGFWDFENKRFNMPIPGNRLVNSSACQPIASDPAE